jgi:hypothetical protein
MNFLQDNSCYLTAYQKSDDLGQKRGGFETLSDSSPMSAIQLAESGHSCPLPPECCFTASNILQEWQSDTVYSERPENASVPRGAVRDLTIF